MTRERRPRTLQELPPRVQSAFEAFLSNANKAVMHQLDWNRFYVVIRLCHQKGIRLSVEEVTTIVERGGFERQYAEEIASVYYHGRMILGGHLYPRRRRAPKV